MARVLGSAGLKPQPLRPEAAPVDTFVDPQAGDKLSKLATALSDFAPHLSQFSDVLSDRQSIADKRAGEEAARKAQESGKTYAQAIKDGLIRPDQSPWFRLGAEESFGRNAAHKYAADLEVQFAQSDAAQSTDPRDFDAFERKFREQWTKDNVGDKRSQYFNQAFGNQSEALVNAKREQFAESAGARLVKAAGESFHAEVFQHVLDGVANGQSVDDITNLVRVSQQRAIAGGMAKSIVNQMTASAIAAAATRANNTTGLAVMDKIKLGTGSLSGTSYGSKAIEIAENSIADYNQRQYTSQRQHEADVQKKAEEGVFSDVVAALDSARDPHSVDLSPFVERMRKVAPDKADDILKMRANWTDSTFSDEPFVRDRTFADIYTKGPSDSGYVDAGYVSRLLAEGHITASTFREMIAQVQTRDREGGGVGKLFKDDGWIQGSKRIRSLFVAEFGFDTAENRWRAESAVTEFTNDYFRWRQSAGVGAGPLDVNKFIADEGQRLLRIKSEASTATDARKVPPGNTGPTVPDWHKSLVTDPSQIRALENEVQEWVSKKRNKLSKNSIDLLQYAGIKPTIKDIQDFVAAQKAIPTSPAINP